MIQDDPGLLQFNQSELEPKPIITKIEVYKTRYCFLDIKGNIYTMGDNHIGILGFEKDSADFKPLLANYVSSISDYSILDMAFSEINLALIAVPRRYQETDKLYLNSYNLKAFKSKSTEIREQIFMKSKSLKSSKFSNMAKIKLDSSLNAMSQRSLNNPLASVEDRLKTPKGSSRKINKFDFKKQFSNRSESKIFAGSNLENAFARSSANLDIILPQIRKRFNIDKKNRKERKEMLI